MIGRAGVKRPGPLSDDDNTCPVPRLTAHLRVLTLCLGAGMNHNKNGLKRLLDEIIEECVGRLVIARKDRRRVGACWYRCCAPKWDITRYSRHLTGR